MEPQKGGVSSSWEGLMQAIHARVHAFKPFMKIVSEEGRRQTWDLNLLPAMTSGPWKFSSG